MRLNLQSDYALRLLMQLAIHPDSLCTIAEVASCYDISKNHLMKVANTLARDGFIETQRGRHGGMRLETSADKIRIGDVIRSAEGDFALVECFQSKQSDCLISPACRLKGILREATEAFMSVLDRYTIQDLVQNNSEITSLLTLERTL